MPKKRRKILMAAAGLLGAVALAGGLRMPKAIAIETLETTQKTIVQTPTTLQMSTTADSTCPDVRLVFARGSGGERWTDRNYLTWKEALESKLETTDLSYEFIDLDYTAMGVGLDNFWPSVRALIGSGDAYEFGKSVDSGVEALKEMINHDDCGATKYVLGGYSQGAMVVSKAVRSLKAEKMIYAATFGDPKIYLPEGKGLFPDACRNKNLSDYRAYVPDCRTYKGLLGAYTPYEPEGFEGKMGAWCNKSDIFCSPYMNLSSHLAYVDDDLYEDAAKVAFDKIATEFHVANTFAAPHDTAILIDSTKSMDTLIRQYKTEALRLARETLAAGGRVALYDYQDLIVGYATRQRCSFETCTLEVFAQELDKITTARKGNGDLPESLLSAANTAMRELDWRYGATKSMVILTDAPYLAPDRDGTTLAQVVALSRQIDPVNFYVITNDDTVAESYAELVEATDGMVLASVDEAPFLTDKILARYDSLPRVEEMDDALIEEELAARPVLEVASVTLAESGQSATVEFSVARGEAVLVALNDYVLGVSDELSVLTVTDLDPLMENALTLVPLGEKLRGEAVQVILNSAGADGDGVPDASGASSASSASGGRGAAVIPLAPNTGRR